MEQPIPHSADVTMYLEVGGTRLSVAGCLGNSCTLRTSSSRQPCYAELVIIIDGQERRKRVYLPKGISEESLDVDFIHETGDLSCRTA